MYEKLYIGLGVVGPTRVRYCFEVSVGGSLLLYLAYSRYCHRVYPLPFSSSMFELDKFREQIHASTFVRDIWWIHCFSSRPRISVIPFHRNLRKQPQPLRNVVSFRIRCEAKMLLLKLNFKNSGILNEVN